MNIYISAENQRQLRMIDGSMSGLVNKLLEQHFSLSSNGRTEAFEASDSGSSPDELANKEWTSAGNRFAQQGKPGEPAVELGYACCLNKKPCKHWIWDGLEQGYVNSITGEIKPVGV